MLGAEVTDALEVAFMGNNYSTLSLDGLDTNSTDVGIVNQFYFQCFQVVVLEQLKSSSEGSELMVPAGVVTSS